MRQFIASSALSPYPFAILAESHRCFNVIQRGNDREVKSLFALLGFGKDSEAHRVCRTRDEFRQGYLLEAMKLRDPQNNPEDATQLAKLQRAYVLLSDDRFRTQYAAHHCNSPDALLHVHVEGGQIAANYNPEHQSFEFVDHALSSSLSSAQRTFGDFTKSFQSATQVCDGPFEAQAYNSCDANAVRNGECINVTLRISFDESILGCTKTIVYEKNITCHHCEGNGRKRFKNPRKCPQCRGRGSVHLPSATYHIERQCGYCGGEGTAPPQRCSACKGHGVQAGHQTSLSIDVRPGTTTMTMSRVRGKGHDGVRGGTPGDLLVTVLVQEHSLFHRDGLDLHMLLPISLSTALLGGIVSVPTLHATKSLRIPPCVRNGQRLTLDGCGVSLDCSSDLVGVDGAGNGGGSVHSSRQQQRSCGNLHVHLLVVMPRANELTGTQRCALKNFTNEGEESADTVEGETSATLKKRLRGWLANA